VQTVSRGSLGGRVQWWHDDGAAFGCIMQDMEVRVLFGLLNFEQRVDGYLLRLLVFQLRNTFKPQHAHCRSSPVVTQSAPPLGK